MMIIIMRSVALAILRSKVTKQPRAHPQGSSHHILHLPLNFEEWSGPQPIRTILRQSLSGR
jgi:hypothetical protein